MRNRPPISSPSDTLDVPVKYFWEYDLEDTNWYEDRFGIIERVLERGNTRDWDELIRFYGKEEIIYSLREKIKYLRDDVMDRVGPYFNMDIKEMRSYIHKQTLAHRTWF